MAGMRLYKVAILPILSLLVWGCGVLPDPPAFTITPRPSTATPIPPTNTPTLRPTYSAVATIYLSPTPTEDPLPNDVELDPEQWMSWPVNPVVTQHVREIYHLGQSLGNDPHGFSILGDCQSTRISFSACTSPIPTNI